MNLNEQLQRAHAERRDGETRAILATASRHRLPGHGWKGEGKCPLCGVMGPHDDRTDEERREPRS